MCRRPAVRLAPLLEDAELRRIGHSRDKHASTHTGTPLFALLTLMIDNPHYCSPKIFATKTHTHACATDQAQQRVGSNLKALWRPIASSSSGLKSSERIPSTVSPIGTYG
jgi:hypothetical protein